MGFGAIIGAITSPGGLVKDIASVVDRFITTPDEKRRFAEKSVEFEVAAAQLVLARDLEIEETMQAEIKAKQAIIVAEMQSGDVFTKRARPMMAYAGMALIVLNYGILPWVARFSGVPATPVPLPVEFWGAWGTVVSVWQVGRSLERRGAQNKVVKAITG